MREKLQGFDGLVSSGETYGERRTRNNLSWEGALPEKDVE